MYRITGHYPVLSPVSLVQEMEHQLQREASFSQASCRAQQHVPGARVNASSLTPFGFFTGVRMP